MTNMSRIKKFYEYMEEEELDMVFLTLPRTIHYLTGFSTNPHERFFSLFIPLVGDPVLIIPELDLNEASCKSCVQNLLTHKDNEDPMEILRRLTKKKAGKCGLEKEHLTLSRFEEIASVVEASIYINVDDEIQKMKVIKSPEEVARIRQAIRISDEALFEGLKIVKPGVTEYEIAAEIQYQKIKLGADGGGLMVVSGEKSALPHGRTGNRALREGDLLLIDGGVLKNGYVSDITRTFGIGEINDQRKKIYETVLAANLAAINAVKPGVSFGELDTIARDVITENGYGGYFTHRLGHGMGMNNHEYPSIHGLNKDVVKVGMVFTIEPGIYVPGVGGVRIEDDILVTDDGVEVLTHYKKELTLL
ncbi:M24 family metallopeptidase [Sporosarcina psychrophila]|uniref:M24 family metallopeptidase n=1 Tax=Sporosarcina psychrophila TaxID=1476 RepID=UPI00078C298F|nr:Xaa-Pro peptidase family protein [Sporosarcina psychrophila]AMQ04970.1 metallopeptidase [Sporosarcina psychrophila]